jgi:hypothetical protein
VKKTRDVSNRRLPPKRTACTRTSCVPGSLSPLSQRGRPTETKAPRGTTGGPDVSRRPKDRFGGSTMQHSTRAPGLTTFGESRAWAFSSHGADAIEPLTPLSQAPESSSASLGFPGAAMSPYVSFGEVGTGRKMWSVPRPPVSTPRERECFVTIRDAFHR